MRRAELEIVLRDNFSKSDPCRRMENNGAVLGGGSRVAYFIDRSNVIMFYTDCKNVGKRNFND